MLLQRFALARPEAQMLLTAAVPNQHLPRDGSSTPAQTLIAVKSTTASTPMPQFACQVPSCPQRQVSNTRCNSVTSVRNERQPPEAAETSM